MFRAVTVLVLGSLLCAAAPAAAEEVTTPVDAVTNEGADAEMLIQTAATRMRQGDLEGAEILLNEVERATDELSVHLLVELKYQRANVRALERRYAPARTQYQAILDEHPSSHRELDAQFRVAELTGVLGEPAAAVKELKRIARTDGLEALDLAKIGFNLAIFTLDSGKDRKGRRLLERALIRTESGLASYYEAKAWVALVSHELDRLDALEVRGSKKRLAKVLGRRAGGMASADQALRETIALQEPEWVLAALLRMAESYEDLGDDILAAPEPDLTPAQLEIYRRELRGQAEQFWVKAVRYLDGGVDVSERLYLSSGRVRTLREERARLMSKIDARADAS